uniref:Uncharacterized protein n=1 Tax=Neovison vison TaxID=452646 RepID=A0A8C7AX28_NEOVI
LSPQGDNKGGKKGVLKFTLECTHPIEDGILDAANCKHFLQETIRCGSVCSVVSHYFTLKRLSFIWCFSQRISYTTTATPN